MMKITQSEYADKVAKCLELINKEIDELNLMHKSNKYKDKMYSIIINHNCYTFKLKPKNIGIIYFGRFYN